ncbi:MAG: zinc ribbon domain-containing protein [Clostridium sp.]|nr:zinc ribbon domain-containing protein [Clostridium sp.]
MICMKCGVNVAEGSCFCTVCGNKIETLSNTESEIRHFCKTCGMPINSEQAVCLNCGVPVGEGKKYCSLCGNSLLSDAVICVKCGCSVNNSQQAQNSMFIESDLYFKKLSDYEKTSGIIWLVIGIIQICTLVGAICGIWNIIAACSRLKYGNELLKKPKDVINNFENQLAQIIIIMILNIFFGAIIGVVGSIFDLFVRNYVIENKQYFSK